MINATVRRKQSTRAEGSEHWPVPPKSNASLHFPLDVTSVVMCTILPTEKYPLELCEHALSLFSLMTYSMTGSLDKHWG